MLIIMQSSDTATDVASSKNILCAVGPYWLVGYFAQMPDGPAARRDTKRFQRPWGERKTGDPLRVARAKIGLSGYQTWKLLLALRGSLFHVESFYNST